jgi:hypothetical protein
MYHGISSNNTAHSSVFPHPRSHCCVSFFQCIFVSFLSLLFSSPFFSSSPFVIFRSIFFSFFLFYVALHPITITRGLLEQFSCLTLDFSSSLLTRGRKPSQFRNLSNKTSKMTAPLSVDGNRQRSICVAGRIIHGLLTEEFSSSKRVG